jgi:hypothetical protein
MEVPHELQLESVAAVNDRIVGEVEGRFLL